MQLAALIYQIFSLNDRKLFIVLCVVVFFFGIETVLNQVSDFLIPQLTSFWGICLFMIVAGVYGVGSYFMLTFVNRHTKQIRSKNKFVRIVHLGVIITQLVLSALLVYVIVAVTIFSQYFTGALLATTIASPTLTIILSIVFAKTFFSWFRPDRTSLIVLLYGLAFAVTAFAIGVATVTDINDLLGKDPVITPASEVVFPSDYYDTNPLLGTLSDTYQYTSAAGFILILIATALLLYNYSKKIGILKFWTIILLPLLYQLSTLVDQLGLYIPETDSELLFFYVFSSLNATVGGILFGIAFYTVAKSIRRDSSVRNYLIITSYGFVLLFLAQQVGLFAASYPPFGFATFCFLGLSTYLVFIGLYSSAISVSQDIQLRKSIKTIATKDTNLLSSIGTAQMEQEIQKTVNSMKGVVAEQEKELEEQTGIEANLEEDEMKNYLEEVMQEVGKVRKSES
jgi:hypothetical protein